MLAIANKSLKVIRLLLASGVEPNLRLAKGKTILMQACDQGNLDIMKALLSAGADVNLQDDADATALMWASHRGHLEAVKLLLHSEQINLDLRNHSGYTAMMLADFNQYPEVLELLQNKAN